MSKTAIVTGSEGGLGSLICEQLEAQGFTVHGWDFTSAKRLSRVDVTSLTEVRDAASQIHRVDVLVNCAGFNQLAPITRMNGNDLLDHMKANAYSILNCVQVLLHKMRGGTVCNVLSNASHIPMTHSLAYNASKAAAAMITRQMARELFPSHNLTIFGVSPNRLAGTPMSNHVDNQVAFLRSWSQDQVAAEQRARMAIGEETPPGAVAEFIGFLLSEKRRHKYLHGAILDYGI